MAADSDDERRSPWIVAGVALAVALPTLAVGLVASPASPCHDATAATPQVEFDVAHDAANGTLSIAHAGGARLTDGNTNSLTVRIGPAGADRDATERVLVSDAVGGYPVERGRTWTIEDATVDGRPLADGDVVRVRWAGPDDLPAYCPNRNEERGTVAKLTVGAEDGG